MYAAIVLPIDIWATSENAVPRPTTAMAGRPPGSVTAQEPGEERW